MAPYIIMVSAYEIKIELFSLSHDFVQKDNYFQCPTCFRPSAT